MVASSETWSPTKQPVRTTVRPQSRWRGVAAVSGSRGLVPVHPEPVPPHGSSTSSRPPVWDVHSALLEHRRRARKQDCSRFHTFTWVFPTACDKHALTEKPRKPAFCEASRFQSGNGTRSAKGPAACLRTNLTAGDFTRSAGNCLGTHQACTKNGQQNITLANSSSSPVARLTSRVCNMRLRRTGTPSSYGLPKV